MPSCVFGTLAGAVIQVTFLFSSQPSFLPLAIAPSQKCLNSWISNFTRKAAPFRSHHDLSDYFLINPPINFPRVAKMRQSLWMNLQTDGARFYE